MTQALKDIVEHSSFNFFSNALLILLYGTFLYNHLIGIYTSVISPTALVFLAMETTVLSLVFLRRTPIVRSDKLIAWVVAVGGTFTPLLLIPSGVVIHQPIGDSLMIIGGLMAVASYLSLNTSFGLSPALRAVKTNGMYKIVRHPMYLSYLVLYAGYLLISFSLINAALIVLMCALLVGRTYFEEELLKTDETYKTYARSVRSRLIPFLF